MAAGIRGDDGLAFTLRRIICRNPLDEFVSIAQSELPFNELARGIKQQELRRISTVFSDKLITFWGVRLGDEKESLVVQLLASLIHVVGLARANFKVWIIHKHQRGLAGTYLFVGSLKAFRDGRPYKPHQY